MIENFTGFVEGECPNCGCKELNYEEYSYDFVYGEMERDYKCPKCDIPGTEYFEFYGDDYEDENSFTRHPPENFTDESFDVYTECNNCGHYFITTYFYSYLRTEFSIPKTVIVNEYGIRPLF